MPRKSPSTGAKPHRDDHQSYVAEDIWHWIKERQNIILLVLTILIAGTVFYIMRIQANRETQRQAQLSLNQALISGGVNGNDGEPIKKAKSYVTRFEGVNQLAPWFYFNLANTYYMDQHYDQAIQTLNELRNKYPGSPASQFSKQFLKGVRQEKAFVQQDLEERKKKLNNRFQRDKLVYEIQESELRQSDDTSSPNGK